MFSTPTPLPSLNYIRMYISQLLIQILNIYVNRPTFVSVHIAHCFILLFLSVFLSLPWERGRGEVKGGRGREGGGVGRRGFATSLSYLFSGIFHCLIVVDSNGILIVSLFHPF